MRIKHPSIPHFHFSPTIQRDDTIIASYDHLNGREVIITTKLDGENTSMYQVGLHARSLDSRHHASRDWVKKFHSTFSYRIPDGWRICGENVYARHSIAYENLDSYFYGFSIWNEYNVALSWDATLEWFEKLGITPVPQLYRGPFDLLKIEQIAKQLDTKTTEGLVCRITDEIPYDQFGLVVAKWVRPNHVQTDKHWMSQEIIPNILKT